MATVAAYLKTAAHASAIVANVKGTAGRAAGTAWRGVAVTATCGGGGTAASEVGTASGTSGGAAGTVGLTSGAATGSAGTARAEATWRGGLRGSRALPPASQAAVARPPAR